MLKVIRKISVQIYILRFGVTPTPFSVFPIFLTCEIGDRTVPFQKPMLHIRFYTAINQNQIRYFVRIKISMFSIICLVYLNFITEITERKNKFGNLYLCVYFCN